MQPHAPYPLPPSCALPSPTFGSLLWTKEKKGGLCGTGAEEKRDFLLFRREGEEDLEDTGEM